jgi:hypothetical protein
MKGSPEIGAKVKETLSLALDKWVK